ncbi:ATP-binding protein [Halosimplex salinum]|uniref:ATP-binding protein n=1 Tax=Halosimplex salinum TaxID=1710538 RepID=UPI000F473C8F|nr:ATP-binding protein [Halosimplex salinum]
MSKFLQGPSTVLVVVGDESMRESITTAVDRRSFRSPVTDDLVRAAAGTDHEQPVDAVAVADCESALDRLESDETVGCVVVDDALADRSVVDCIEATTEQYPDLPVVVYAADGDEAVASATTRAGAFAYLPQPADATAVPDHGDLLETVEEALSVHDRRYRAATQSAVLDTLFAEIQIPMYVKDESARHLKFADVHGAPDPEAAIGRTDWELYSWNDESKVEALGDDRLVIDEGESIREREERHGPPEAGRWLKTTKIPWRDGDHTRGLVGVSQDVTDEKRKIRDLRAQNRRLDDFTSFVAHDLRNPLHVAMAYQEFAREGDEAAADRVSDALDRMEELVDNMSELAASGGTAPAPVGGVQFHSFLQVVWDEVAPATATLDIAMPPETTLYTNRLQLKPLFENLFKNSLEHGSTDGRPRADDAHRYAGADVTVRVGITGDGFFVEDDGPGIPDDEREDVLEDGYTTAASGTGTGLAIVSEIADTHGWDVRIVESAEGGVPDGDGESGARESDRSPGARFEFDNVLLVTDPEPMCGSGSRRPLTTGADVGRVLNAGESSHDESVDTWTLTAAGDNLLGHTNEFHFRWASLRGACRIEARLVDFDAPADRSKAGVMIRSDATETATFGYVGRTGDGRTEVLWRTDDGEPTRSQLLESGDRSFEWFALERTGDRVTAFVSADGDDWHAIDQRSVALTDPVCVGLAACSILIGAYCEATFDRVSAVELDRE